MQPLEYLAKTYRNSVKVKNAASYVLKSLHGCHFQTRSLLNWVVSNFKIWFASKNPLEIMKKTQLFSYFCGYCVNGNKFGTKKLTKIKF